MPWTISPDSLDVSTRPTGGFDDEATARGTEQSPEETEHALVETTRAYLACLASGDIPGPRQTSAWDEFYRTYAPFVVRVVRDQCKMTGDSDDGVQDVWQAIVTQLAAFRADPAQRRFHAWLRVVARRRVADRLRSDARKLRPATRDESPDQREGTEEDPAVACERNEERTLFVSLLAELRVRATPLSYRVLQLRTLEGRTVPEVARLVGLTVTQVRARNHRMVAKLRRLAGTADGRDSEPTKQIPKKFPTAAQQRPVT